MTRTPTRWLPDAIGLPGTLFLYRDRVRIVAGRFDAAHDRLFERGAKSTLPEHRAAHVAAVSGKRGSATSSGSICSPWAAPPWST